MIIMLQLETERLIIQCYCSEDIDNINKLRSDPLVWRYSTRSVSESIEESKIYLEDILHNYEINKPDFQGLFLKSTHEYIGEAGVLSYVERNRRAVIGYNLLPEYWHKGYATEITKAMVNHLFKNEGIERIEALVLESNKASRRVLEKAGFAAEGLLRHFTFINNEYHNVCYYGMIKSDFISIR